MGTSPACAATIAAWLISTPLGAPFEPFVFVFVLFCLSKQVPRQQHFSQLFAVMRVRTFGIGDDRGRGGVGYDGLDGLL
jgi:hypothetical protein